MKHISIPERREKTKTQSMPDVFNTIRWSRRHFSSHRELAASLRSRNPYTITVLIENLDPMLWNNKAFVKKTRVPTASLYIQRLYQYFDDEFGAREGHERYVQWLDAYRKQWKREGMTREIDEYIVERELWPRYRSRFPRDATALAKLKAPHFRIERERYYRVPAPFDHVDWRNPYDTIFVWGASRRRVACRGGSGSSGQRETNSKFIYGMALINKKQAVPSYLFVYTKRNELVYITSFPSLTVPLRDIGSNYHLGQKEEDAALRGVHFLEWNPSEEEFSTVTVFKSRKAVNEWYMRERPVYRLGTKIRYEEPNISKRTGKR